MKLFQLPESFALHSAQWCMYVGKRIFIYCLFAIQAILVLKFWNFTLVCVCGWMQNSGQNQAQIGIMICLSFKWSSFFALTTHLKLMTVWPLAVHGVFLYQLFFDQILMYNEFVIKNVCHFVGNLFWHSSSLSSKCITHCNLLGMQGFWWLML